MNGRRVEEPRDAFEFIGVNMRPETMGIMQAHFEAMLEALSALRRKRHCRLPLPMT